MIPGTTPHQYVQALSGAAVEASNTAANDLKVIAKTVQAMGRTERRLLTAGKWLKVLTANGQDLPDGTKVGTDSRQKQLDVLQDRFWHHLSG